MNEEEKAVQVAIFHAARELWERQTFIYSDPGVIMDHPCFRAIVAMGEQAVPLLLEEVAKDPWVGFFCALTTISKSVPYVAEKDQGKVVPTARAWIDWGKDYNHIGQLRYERLCFVLEEYADKLNSGTP